MHFAIQRELLVRALKYVNSAISSRVVQPILSNVLIESAGDTTIRITATDLDLTIKIEATGVVYTGGTVTLPGKKLLEVMAKFPDDLVTFQVDRETFEVRLTCKRSRFSLSGLNPEDFPAVIDSSTVDGLVMPGDVLHHSLLLTAFAATTYDTGNVLCGVYLLVENGVFEAAATDGSRLAHSRQELTVAAASRLEHGEAQDADTSHRVATLDRPVALKAIVPARACAELLKLLDSTTPSDVRIAVKEGQITFHGDRFFLGSRMIGGDYPRYKELFPTEVKYEASLSRQEVAEAIERVAVMSDQRTNLINLHFEGDTLQITANTPDVGRAQEEVPVRFEGPVLDVVVNVRYMLDVLQKLSSKKVMLEMTGALKPLVFKGMEEEGYRYLLMPVQSG